MNLHSRLSASRYHNARPICDSTRDPDGPGCEVIGPALVPKPAERERRLPRVAFAGGWKAQGPDDNHALLLWVELTRGEARKLREQRVVGPKMDNDRSALRSNKEFSSELQVINGF